MNKKKRKTKIIMISVLAIVFVSLIIFFTTAIYFGYAPDYLTKIVCKEQPYDDIEIYFEQEPYQTTEDYYEKEPYTTKERYCSDRSWWSGDCISWNSREITKYRNVRKTRTVTKYRNERKERTIVKYQTVCVRIYLWKSVDYSENWMEYSELYNREGERLK